MEKLYGIYRKLIIFLANADDSMKNKAVCGIRPEDLADILSNDAIAVKAEDIPDILRMLNKKDYITVLNEFIDGSTGFKIDQANCQAYLEWEKDNQNANNPVSFSITGSNNFINVGSNNSISNNTLINDIENKIEENGGEDKEELKRVLNEVKAACDTWNKTGQTPDLRAIKNNISNHLAKHGWFYGAVTSLLGNTALNLKF